FIEQTLREATGSDVISIFAAGCCGDINHVDPASRQRNKADFIGGSLGETIQAALPELKPLEQPQLVVRSQVVQLPLQGATEEELARALRILAAVKAGEKVDFFEHVTAY